MGCSSSSPAQASAPSQVPSEAQRPHSERPSPPPPGSIPPPPPSTQNSPPVIAEAQIVNSVNLSKESLPIAATAVLVSSASPPPPPPFKPAPPSHPSISSSPPPPSSPHSSISERDDVSSPTSSATSSKKKMKPLPVTKQQEIDPDALSASSLFSLLFLVSSEEDEEEDEEEALPTLVHVLHSSQVDHFFSKSESNININSIRQRYSGLNRVTLSPTFRAILSPTSTVTSLKCFSFIFSTQEAKSSGLLEKGSLPARDVCLQILSHFHDQYGLKIKTEVMSQTDFFDVI